jgi:hypothetical protein
VWPFFFLFSNKNHHYFILLFLFSFLVSSSSVDSVQFGSVESEVDEMVMKMMMMRWETVLVSCLLIILIRV